MVFGLRTFASIATSTQREREKETERDRGSHLSRCDSR